MADAQIIDGRTLAAQLQGRIATAASALRARHGWAPGLAAVLVGDDPASAVYVRSKRRACEAAGMASFEHRLPGETPQSAVLDLLSRLNADDRVDGILVQLPLPPLIESREVIAAVDPAKDIDGFHPVNIGRLWEGAAGPVPCTPQGIMLLLRSVRHDLTGACAIVLGRSQIVGRPVAALLLAADCTVTIAHSKTRDLPRLCREADILVAAVGRPHIVKRDWIRPGAIVVDVGINRVAAENGKPRLVGDVDFAEAVGVAGAITPVPGGVGPMTIACLLANTLRAACRRRGLTDPLGNW